MLLYSTLIVPIFKKLLAIVSSKKTWESSCPNCAPTPCKSTCLHALHTCPLTHTRTHSHTHLLPLEISLEFYWTYGIIWRRLISFQYQVFPSWYMEYCSFYSCLFCSSVEFYSSCIFDITHFVFLVAIVSRALFIIFILYYEMNIFIFISYNYYTLGYYWI